MNPKTIFYLLPNAGKLLYALRAMRSQEVLPTREHMKLCGEWFLVAQEDAGGYAASFGFVTGLRHAYIETTGYIIPTMLDLAAALGDERFLASALRAGEWLLTIQHESGAFTDIDAYKPQVFDTGQVMLGLNRLYRETKDARYLEATRRAADWLVRVQDADGSWTKAAYHAGDCATYMTRVAAAMLESAQLTGEEQHREGGVKFLRWAAGRQRANGFFLNCELSPDADPVLHTMVYVLEGFLTAYQVTGDGEWLEIMLKGARPLLKVQMDRDLVPRSQYNANWEVTNAEKCIPGLAQWAGLCLALHTITKDDAWRDAAQLSIYYLKSKQLRGKGILHGALPASVPLWGYYHPMMLPNWAVKFFADALLLYQKHGFEVWQEQEAWVKKCFELRLDGGGWSAHSKTFDPFDELMCGAIRDALARGGFKSGHVLDLGCGEGRYLSRMETLLPGATFSGVDPLASGDTGKVRRGSAYAIPFPDGSLDAVYSYIVFQHLHEPERALAEARRVLKPGGVLVIADRDPLSGRGFKKALHELRGRWMYPWDSPFRERWHRAGAWRRMLASAGFETTGLRRLVGAGETGLKRFARVNAFLVVGGVKK